MLSNHPVVQVGKRQGEREDFVGWRNAASGLLESSPLYHASTQDALTPLGDFFLEISLVAHLRRELEGNPLGKSVQEESTCFPGRTTRGLFLVGMGVSEAQQSHGVMCVCAHGVGQQVVAVLSTYCLKVSGLYCPSP